MTQTIQLFVTCILDTLYPQIALNTVQVLQRVGVQVMVPKDQTCCGQPAYNAGLRKDARPAAMHTLRLLEHNPAPVVVPSGSCAGMLRYGYPELFAHDPEWLSRAQAVAERTYEFTQYLVDVLGVTDVGAYFSGRLTYHASCHLLRELGIHRQPLALLQAVRGAELVELPSYDDCCGFGGVFSVEHPQLSGALLERKITNLQATGASTFVAGDAGCLTNINGGLQRRKLPLRGVHIAEILACTE